MITLTDRAADQFRAQGAAEGLRVGVLPGGCSGFQYSLTTETGTDDDDLVFDVNGIRVIVDPFSAQYLAGIEIDYTATLRASGFVFRNPNATGGCGCGSSFSA
jgi:iron-sulfur cluster assembly accessory protein